jgi:hypothetical protein
MSTKPLTPERRKFLKLCIKLIKERESAIRYGARRVAWIGNPRCSDPFSILRQKSLCQKVHARGFEVYAESLMKLKIIRSKFAAELKGLHW